MNNYNESFRPKRGCFLGATTLAALAASWATAQAGDTLFTNSGFDADAAGWYWENWSAAGSTAAFDGANNSVVSGSPAASGSLKLVSAFTSASGYQQAVYTVPLAGPENYNGQIGAVSFDVKVDESSTTRADGDYGWLELVLRQGNNWDWVVLPGVRLNGNGWQRVTYQVPKDGVDSIRALTIKLGENDFLGPVTLNVDNIAYTTHPDDVVISNVDNGSVDVAPDGWTWENWSVQGLFSFDPADTHGRSTSGTIKLEHQFTSVPNGYQQSVFTYALPGGEVDAAKDYSFVNLDVKVDASSTPRASGDYGYFEVILRNGSGWDWLATEIDGASGTRFTDNEWHHLTLKLSPLASQVHHLTFKVGENGLLGPVTLNIDNLSFTRNTAPPPPPTMGFAKAQAGLSLVTTSNDQYGRHNIYTTDDLENPAKYSFVGVTEPVSYSFTLNSYPDATAYPGFQAHIFLVPGTPGTETSPDWNEPTLIFMDIKANAAGGGNATFRIKTDQAGNNTELYGGGDPHTTVNSAAILGTWTLTANGNIFTMTAPDGTVSDPIDIGDEAAAYFKGDGVSPLRVYFGVQPNGDANKGQSVSVGGVQIKKGAQVLAADNFTGNELDPTLWTPNATAGGVRFIPASEAGYVISWTVPDAGFEVQTSTSLKDPNWTKLEVTPVTVGQQRQVVVPPSAIPAGDEVYLRMYQPEPGAE
ncbi:MAG TPA: hypothetical protein PLX89_09580 [Verrucomicrobiota bacterium]|nr:hypothetical protein [Verrucomicrobiales bacterium]HRI13245.1 hypothetical protein [Verrucomicrobiota bacterium]